MSTQEEIDLKNFINYLSRYYADVDTRQPYYQHTEAKDLPIWQVWMQGWENAPKIVSRCFKSVEKYCDGRPIGTLSRDNMHAAGIDIPQYILDKYERKVISEAHMSDLLRLCLLEKYGGTWIDATVLLTGSLPQGIVSQPFFAFRAETGNIFSAHALLSNWFIHAMPNHIFVRNLKNALFRYWRFEEQALNYFIFHYMAHGMVFTNPMLTQVWFRWSQQTNAPCFQLDWLLDKPFDKQTLQRVKSATNIHKLSYRRITGISNPPPDSFLNVIVNEPERLEN